MELRSAKKRKYTKTGTKQKKGDKDIIDKTLRSKNKKGKIKSENNVEKTHLKIEGKVDKKHNTKTLIRELDEFIAENTQLTCCLCAVPLKDFTDLKKHFRQEHQCVGYIPCCNNRYRKRTLYVDHLKLHKDPDFFK